VNAKSTQLAISGMNCANCARHVTEALQGVAGVESARVNLEGGRAVVRWTRDAKPATEMLVGAVESAGFKAKIETGPAAAATPTAVPGAGWQFNVVLGSGATAALMICEWGLGWGMERFYQWGAGVIALVVQVFCGARFYRGAWAQFRHGRSNMDTLVALGSSTALGYSFWGLLAGWHAHLYFMEAVAIITFISIGHWLEALATARAAGSVRALLDLTPATARRLRADGDEEITPVASLAIDELIVLKPGDRVPVDGMVEEGASAVDEAMLTGESAPVEKGPGARVYAGTTNLNGRLVMEVAAAGDATALAGIIAVVQRAQESRAGIQKLGDRVSDIFVPVVILVAIATAFWWGLAPETARAMTHWLEGYLWPVHVPASALAAAVVHAAAVLIIACPCAMGLATPAAIMAGTNVAARRGILIRDAAALEKSGTITAVLFDKTGTLTHGRLAIAAWLDLRARAGNLTALEVIAAALAQPSNHPVSRALATAGSGAGGPVHDWREHQGRGVEGRLEDAVWQMGSMAWLTESRVDLTAGAEFMNQWNTRGATVIALARSNVLCGMVALRDTPKSGARDIVDALSRKKIKVFMVSGDRREAAEAVAREIGLPGTNLFADVRPERKAAIVGELQARGERVAFVGDGINDAPALEQADLGIAVSRASDVAREAADIILLNSDLHAVPGAIGLAQATLRTIKQNLFWAFVYNAAAVPLAAMGFLSPVVSAIAMGMSDLLVIGNALRLRQWRDG
jgi:Cu+-exporting ATPase